MNDIIKFTREKDYKYIKELGHGSFGQTVLLKDEELDMFYACKKYQLNFETRTDYFKKFISEIKIMNRMLNENIVRIYNSYLYSQEKVGYILMEYVEGVNIADYIAMYPAKTENVFEQLINAFNYLESRKICHRDIRATNILVNKEDKVKIIDFGFGKEFDSKSLVGDSTMKISWICDLPNEMLNSNPRYDNLTDMYFLGALIDQILRKNKIEFKYQKIINKMMKKNPEERYKSFSDILSYMNEKGMSELLMMNDDVKKTYQDFINKLEILINEIGSTSTINTNKEKILEELLKVYNTNVLEDNIIENSKLINCFIKGEYKYYNPRFNSYRKKWEYTIPVVNLKNFIDLLEKSDDTQSNTLINSIENRLKKIRRYSIFNDDKLPF